MTPATVHENEIEAFVRSHPDVTVEALAVRFPGADIWNLRNIRRDVRRQQASGDVTEEAVLTSAPLRDLGKKAKLMLNAGFFRPIRVEMQERPAPPSLWKRAGHQTLVISDVHAPETDMDALDVTMQVGHAAGVDQIIIAGDGFDAHSVAKYAPAADRPLRWVEERQQAVPIIAGIREEFPDKKIVWLHGNHDIRPLSYVAAQAPALQGLQTLPEMLGIDSLGFEFPEDNRVLLADGQLMVKHGSKVAGEAGASVQKEVKDAGISVVMGHVHRLAYYSATRASQRIREIQPLVGVELGCLASLRPSYLLTEDTANWQQGGALITEYDNGLYNVELIPIFGGVAFFRGRVFSSRFRDGVL